MLTMVVVGSLSSATLGFMSCCDDSPVYYCLCFCVSRLLYCQGAVYVFRYFISVLHFISDL